MSPSPPLALALLLILGCGRSDPAPMATPAPPVASNPSLPGASSQPLPVESPTLLGPDSIVADEPTPTGSGDTTLLVTVYTTLPIEVRRPGPSTELTDVRWATHPDYDRVVFTFAGDRVPSYRLARTAEPIADCGSGEPVAVAGAVRLVLSLSDARAHTEAGQPTAAGRRATPELPVVREIVRTCDFEGQVAYALGLRRAGARHRVQTLTSPSRLVVDIQN